MIERAIERALFASRCLPAPLYLGLSPALMGFGSINARQIPDDKMLRYVRAHLTIVVPAVMMGVPDTLAFAAHRDS